MSLGLYQGLAGAALWLLPWLLLRASRKRYLQHRRTWVFLFRVAVLALPSFSQQLAQVSHPTLPHPA